MPLLSPLDRGSCNNSVPSAVADKRDDNEHCAASVGDDVVVKIDFDAFCALHYLVVVDYCFVAAD